MYSVIRIILFLAVPLLLFLVISKTKRRFSRRVYCLSAVIWIVICCLSHYVPIENALFSFATPEAVFGYTNYEQIQYIVQGKESCLIVYPTVTSTYSFTFVGKDQHQYRILPQYSAEMVAHRSDSSGIIDVYRVKNTNDYYIIATLWADAEVYLCDEFGKVNAMIMTIENTGFFHIYVDSISESHYLLIDNKPVTIIS